MDFLDTAPAAAAAAAAFPLFQLSEAFIHLS